MYQLPWRSESGPAASSRALINDWQINGIFGAFSGSPFTVTADGTTLNTPGNLQTADFVGTVTKIGEIGANGFYYDPAAWAQPDGVRFGTAPGQSVPRSRRLEPRPLGLPRVPARRHAKDRSPARSGQRHEYVEVRQPDEQPQSGDFMRIFGLVYLRMPSVSSGSRSGTVSNRRSGDQELGYQEVRRSGEDTTLPELADLRVHFVRAGQG